MSQTAPIDHRTRSRQDAPRAEHGFKPLALPALAAAVHASRRPARPAESRRDVPAVLREDAVLG